MDITGIALSKQMDNRKNLIRYPNGPLSPAAPIVPTYTGFEDQAPTDLENFTDGNLTTSTGEAKKVLGGSGAGGYFVFDLWSEKNILVTGKMNIGATGGATSTVFIELALTDGTYISSPSYNAYTAGTYPILKLLSPFTGTARYIRLRVGASGASTVSASGVELMVYDLGEL